MRKLYILIIAFAVLLLVEGAFLQAIPNTDISQQPDIAETTPLSEPPSTPNPISHKLYVDEVFGFSFEYPANVYLRNESRTDNRIYLEFCNETTCGMEVSEFFIAEKTDARDLFSIAFDYASGWRYIAPEPYPIVTESTGTKSIGARTWLVTEIGYSNAGRFIQYLTWYQTLVGGALISFAISPETADIILPSLHSIAH